MRSQVMLKRIVIVVLVSALLAVIFWAFRPSPAYAIERVHPRLRALRTPYQSVRASLYSDGGSVGIEIVDRDGHREQFTIPAPLGDTNRYTRVFVGAMHYRKPDAVEIAEPEHTKRMLIRILQDRPTRTAWDDACLMSLRHRPLDVVRVLVHKWKGDYNL